VSQELVGEASKHRKKEQEKKLKKMDGNSLMISFTLSI